MCTMYPFNLKRKHSYVSKTEFWELLIFPHILNCLLMLINSESHHGLLACSIVYTRSVPKVMRVIFLRSTEGPGRKVGGSRQWEGEPRYTV